MAQLVSVNVGLPKDVQWQGRTVFTGVYKDTVHGPQRVRTLNIDGDGQGDLGGHGGVHRAVFVYQLGSYRHWERELQRDDFVYGQFGENFTVDGLDDDEVCIGDRYRIGTALFEVSQPRVTCYRVGLRMNEPRIPALLVSHHRPGFYFRVLEEGEVQAGDAIEKVAAGPDAMTVAEVDALLYLPGHPRQQLERALRIESLSPGWQGSFRAMLDGESGLTLVSPPPAWTGFRQLTVTAIDHETPTIISITLADPDGAALPVARPGQYLTLRVGSVLRNYSLSGAPGVYRVSVKHEPEGVASGYLHSQLAIGDRVEVAAPRGTFLLDQGSGPVLLISAGIGATPVLAMLHALAHEREVWWLHGARSEQEHVFAAEAAAVLASLPNAHAHVFYSSAGERLTGARLAELDLPVDAEAYICGPAPFMDEISAGLAALGLAGAHIHTEPFGPAAGFTPGIAPVAARPPHAPAGEPGTGPTVQFARSNVAVPWSDGFASLLELAEACDVPVRWSCRTGVCHSCESTLIAGAVTYDPDPVEPASEGSALICCSRPAGELVLDL